MDSSNPVEAKPKPRKRHKKLGSFTDAEKTIVEDIVAQSPGGLNTSEVNALARVLRRNREIIKAAVIEAAETLADRAGRYADIHLQTTEAALANGDAKSLEVAARASQWALENISVDGVAVVEKKADKPTGPQINIGVIVGGKNETPVVTEITDAELKNTNV